MAADPTIGLGGADKDMSLALAWNTLLSVTALGNAIAWGWVCGRRSRNPPASLSWHGVWGARKGLALVYVIACGVRSIWPRHDGDRACFWPHPLSPPLVGRSLAFTAELCFAALVCMTVARVINTPGVRRLATVVMWANLAAQLACNYGVITHDQRGHVLESSIWTASAAAFTLVCAAALAGGFPHASISTSPPARSFLIGMAVGGACFVAFMFAVDLPMYIGRARADAASGRVFSSWSEGIDEIATCAIVTQSDAYWKEEMPWMTGYFTMGVWLALWLSHVSIQPAAAVDTHTTAERHTGVQTRQSKANKSKGA